MLTDSIEHPNRAATIIYVQIGAIYLPRWRLMFDVYIYIDNYLYSLTSILTIIDIDRDPG